MGFTLKTYLSAHRRAIKIADQAMIDHIRCMRGPEAALKWYHTARLIRKRLTKKLGAFWAHFS